MLQTVIQNPRKKQFAINDIYLDLLHNDYFILFFSLYNTNIKRIFEKKNIILNCKT